MLEIGKFYEMVARPVFAENWMEALGGVVGYWHRFESTMFGIMIPPNIKDLVSHAVNATRTELMKPQPFVYPFDS